MGLAVAPCGDELCGTIVWLSEPTLPDGRVKKDVSNPDPSLRDRTILGLTILRGLPGEPDAGVRLEVMRLADEEVTCQGRCRVAP